MAKWGKIKSRGKVEDRRGLAPVVGGISVTGVALLFLVNYLSGGTPGDFLTQLQDVPVQTEQAVQTDDEFAGEDEYEVFASTVLGSNNQMWESIFNNQGLSYREPLLVLFRQATESSCGGANSQVGPHYCPSDKTIYLDETFFDEMIRRFGAQGGDVAEAYVIAHEVGHHVQNELGIISNTRRTQEQQIKIELQADCFAGMWANSIRDQNVLSPGEIREAMDAASSVGDDRIQKSTTGSVNPETWTHGSSEQRVKMFTLGYETGDFEQCN